MLSCRRLSYSKKEELAEMATLCHSLSFIVTRCTTRFHSLYHSLSLVVIRCHSMYYSLFFVVIRCTTDLSFYKRSSSPRVHRQSTWVFFYVGKLWRLSMLQVILVYIFITWNNIFLCFQNCHRPNKFAKAKCKISEEWNSIKHFIVINQSVWKMAKNVDLQDDTKLAYEVQKYKYI